MRHFVRIAAFLAMSMSTWVGAGPVAAQCPELDLRFKSPKSAQIQALAVYDDGSGPRLYSGEVGTGLGVWNGRDWLAFTELAGKDIYAMRVHDFGNGPELVVAGNFTLIDALQANSIAAWNGTSWRALGAGLNGTVLGLGAFDAGLGSRLIATGDFTNSGAVSTRNIATFDGNAWQPLGQGLDGPGAALTVFDDGAGSKLVVGGSFSQAGSTACANLARWNGSTWSAFGSGADSSVYALITLHAPSSNALVIGGDFSNVDGVAANLVARFDGTNWSALGTTSPLVHVETLLQDGTALYAAGLRNFGPPSSQSANIARWDGVSWQIPGQGLGLATFVGIEALAFFDPNDGAGTRLFAAGGFSPQDGEPRSIAQWNGTTWSALREDNAQGLLHDTNERGALSATMWQGDLVVAGQFTGAGSAPNARGIARWNGLAWQTLGVVPAYSTWDYPALVRSVDVGAGPELVLGMHHDLGVTGVSVPLYRQSGSSWVPFAAGSTPTGVSTGVNDVAKFDDGSGSKLYAGGWGLYAQPNSPGDSVVRWNGSAWERLGSGASASPDGSVSRLFVHDDGSGPALYAGGAMPGGIQRWNGSTWSIVGSGFTAFGGAPAFVGDLQSFDDGTGAKLYASGNIQFAGNLAVNGIARWNGATWENVPGTSAPFVAMGDLEVFDDGAGAGKRLLSMGADNVLSAFDGHVWATLAFVEPFFTSAHLSVFENLPGGRGIVLHGNFREALDPGDPQATEQPGFTILRDCPPVASFCAGDGLDPQMWFSCPCGNTGAPGHGCAWNSTSAGSAGARLSFTGTPATNDLVLVADQMPTNGSSLFFQGTTANLQGAFFGDGLRCTIGTIVRLRTRINVGGAARVPNASEPSLASIGGVVPGSGVVRSYQAWFRVAANFCTASTFNTTNALRVHW